ncbi:hypothetical protein EON63_09365 [archaeon]|nr:MAG: hypothetical protein EON63_09365 [archaeon]
MSSISRLVYVYLYATSIVFIYFFVCIYIHIHIHISYSCIHIHAELSHTHDHTHTHTLKHTQTHAFPSPGGKCTSIPLSQRPLVHILLVQENMRMDTLQFTLDAIHASMGHTHNDMYVVLLTYGHRVGVYTLGSSGDMGDGHGDDGYRYGSTGRVLVQYSQYEGRGEGEEGGLVVPLEDVCNFWDTIKPIGECR